MTHDGLVETEQRLEPPCFLEGRNRHARRRRRPYVVVTAAGQGSFGRGCRRMTRRAA